MKSLIDLVLPLSYRFLAIHLMKEPLITSHKGNTNSVNWYLRLCIGGFRYMNRNSQILSEELFKSQCIIQNWEIFSQNQSSEKCKF